MYYVLGRCIFYMLDDRKEKGVAAAEQKSRAFLAITPLILTGFLLMRELETQSGRGG